MARYIRVLLALALAATSFPILPARGQVVEVPADIGSAGLQPGAGGASGEERPSIDGGLGVQPTALTALTLSGPSPARTPELLALPAGISAAPAPQGAAGSARALPEPSDGRGTGGVSERLSLALDKAMVRWRMRWGKKTDPAELLLPHLDDLWERGSLTEEDLRSWSPEVSQAGMESTRHAEVALALGKNVDPSHWPIYEAPAPRLLLAKSWEIWGALPQWRRELAKNASTPADILSRLGEDPDPVVVLRLAANPSTPREVLRELGSRWVQRQMAEGVAPGEFAKGLAVLDHKIAANPAAPVDLLRDLARSGDPIRRAYAAGNTSMPPDVLATLAADPDDEVRKAAAGNPSTPAPVLAELASGSREDVFAEVAGNPSTPQAVLERLASDRHWGVQVKLASNPSTPPAVLKALSLIPGYGLREILAQNPSTPPEVLAAFLKKIQKSNGWGLVWLAANPSTPIDVLRRLAKHGSQTIQEAAAKNLRRRDAGGRMPVARQQRLLAAVGAIAEDRKVGVLRRLGVHPREIQEFAARTRAVDPAARDLLTQSSFVPLTARDGSSASMPFKNILMDVRGSRGGNGDVAAGWLTALDLLERASAALAKPAITFLMDSTEQGILGRLAGTSVAPGTELHGGNIRFHTIDSLPKDTPTADLYLSLARPSGRFEHESDFKAFSLREFLKAFWKAYRMDMYFGPIWNPYGAVVEAFRKSLGAMRGHIPVDGRTVLIAQTVLGNTENQNSRNPFALIRKGANSLTLLPAGLGDREAGVYTDPVAWKLRDETPEGARRFVLENLGAVRSKSDALALNLLLNGRLLQGSEVGLVYGISAGEVKPQFEKYLKGLVEAAEKSGKSYTLVTPSRFKLEDVQDKDLRAKLSMVKKRKAEPGHVYLLRTETLPHPVFVGLMAYSRPPPVVAGDGAMSAAIGLGRPFVLTQVAWNQKNIGNLKTRLQEMTGDPKERDLFEAVYGKIDLSRALELAGFDAHFRQLAETIPAFTDAMLAVAKAALWLDDPVVSVDRLLDGIIDPEMRLGAVAYRAYAGDREARRRLGGLLLGVDPGTQDRLLGSLKRHMRGFRGGSGRLWGLLGSAPAPSAN